MPYTPLTSDAVDIVYATNVLHELPGLEVISLAYRVLKNNGLLVITDVVSTKPAIVGSIKRFLEYRILHKRLETPYTIQEIIGCIRNSGFNIIESTIYRGSTGYRLLLIASKR